MKKLSEILQSNPRIVLGLFLILVAGAFYPALQIKTDFNLENFFPEDDPTIDDYEKLEREFGRDDNTIMVGFKDDSLFSEKVLSDLQAITDSLEKVKNVQKVRSLWSATQITTRGNRLNFDPYLENLSLDWKNLKDIQEELTKDPFTESFLVNKAGNVTAFYIEIAKGKNNFSVREDIIDELQRILDPYKKRYEFKISGIPHYRNQYVHYLNDEILFYITLSSVLIIILLWGLYRSIPGIVIPMIVVWFTILFALAVMQLTGGYFEVMTSTIAPILLCVGIADSIHMISKYDDARVQGLNKKNAITEMLQTLGSATFLTSITTAIGFGTLITSNIVPMKRFGIYTAVGVMIAYLVTIFLLPSSLKITNINKVFSDKSDRVFE
ncbi:MAG: MMPL family transporter [Balneolaceae bacterium]|nr:MMPL family transporter [Balneolaceae bacterium]